MTDVSPTHEWPRPRQHVSFNLPVVATGVAGVWQLAAGEASRNYAVVVDRNTQIAVAVLFIVSAVLVIAAMIPPTLHRAWVLLRPVRPIV